ncbi:unnamed protein product [Rangifer tarandus platyrhynchus]|uniref:Uncharacterized protein n=1 Tax=Rangifer tarandus platyrhynchus TaxID=3082113 RepID=A0ABN8ZBQ7_RANTA|nr:unnamed protein product [Rangifer tarandus platyrhynchus]
MATEKWTAASRPVTLPLQLGKHLCLCPPICSSGTCEPDKPSGSRDTLVFTHFRLCGQRPQPQSRWKRQPSLCSSKSCSISSRKALETQEAQRQQQGPWAIPLAEVVDDTKC